MPVTSKDQLRLDNLNKLADNNTGGITAQVLRDLFLDLIDTNQGQQVENIILSPWDLDPTGKTDVVICLPGADIIKLPPVASYDSRFLYIGNDSGGMVSFFPQLGETVDSSAGIVFKGNAFVVLRRDRANPANWNILFDSTRPLDLTLAAQANDVEYSQTFPEGGKTLVRDGLTKKWRDEFPVLQNSYFYQENNAVATTIANSNEWTAVNCDLSQFPVPDLTASGNQITYNGTILAVITISWAFSATGGNQRSCQFAIFKDFGGPGEAKLIGIAELELQGDPEAGILQTKTYVDSGDVLTLCCQNLENTSDITVTQSTIQCNLTRL